MNATRNTPLAHVESVLKKRVHPNQRLTLGLSGGLDSVVLLDLLSQLQHPLQFRLTALYVDHQISPHSGRWGDFCRRLCERHAIELNIVKVCLPSQTGESLEALARAARYAMFEQCEADWIVLAHHLDDQAETLLLQLLRGCGVDGASAMGETRRQFLRPLLDVSRRALSDYAQVRKLEWIEDESNQDARFDRNFLRRQIFPLLEQRFPAYRETLARSARHFAESKHLQDELAQADGVTSIQPNRLSIASLSQLSDGRARNLLRYFLKYHAITLPSAVKLQEMLNQLLNAKQDARVSFALGSLSLRRYNGMAWLVSACNAAEAVMISRCWSGEKHITLTEWGKTLGFRMAQGEGISLEKLRLGVVNIQSRVGGERLKPDCQRPRRTLKHLLQEAGIPPWARNQQLLVYSSEKLVAVMGIGVDCEFQARPDEKGIVLEWI
ncbi:MAG: tRNA lysidine(34) synthetase TilS [Sulfuricellaceae bacterium]|nr:tRNA lysidine(34) synthetase TilS [Sulfuricellaceae bacterium]